MERETIEIQKTLLAEGGKAGKYQDLVVGGRGLFRLLKYELVMSTMNIPGALGLLLRKKLYPRLLGHVGRNVTFGMGVVLRHPRKIFIGDDVIIDDHCVLDAKGSDNHGIFIGDGVFLGRNTILNCKNGDIVLEARANIGFNGHLFSASEVRVGSENLIGAYTYLVGGTHRFEDPTLPVLRQGRSSQGIYIGPGGWLGAHVTVLDGVRIGRHAVIGAGSAVHRNIPDYAVAGGNPVTMIHKRRVEDSELSHAHVTVGIINYNREGILEETIASVAAQDYGWIDRVLLVDNASTDGSAALVRERFPGLELIEMSVNRGPNPARNEAILAAESEYVLLMDSDVCLAENAVSLLVDAMARHPDAGVAGAQVRTKGRREEIQYNGADIHFVGGAVRNQREWIEQRVAAVSGGAMLLDRRKAEEVSLFDEDFVFGWEDGDFTFRMTIAGYPCIMVSDAHAYHPEEEKGIRWVDYQVRNRWWFILKNYHVRTLLVLLPAICLYHSAIFFFFLMKGRAFLYIKGSLAVLGTLPAVLRKRKAVMAVKKRRDREVLCGRGIDMIGDAGRLPLVRGMMRVFNILFGAYWACTRWFIE